MSRSGYSDDFDSQLLNIYRANVSRALGGKRGQKMLRELLVALDAMPVKRLIDGHLEDDGEVCALGALAKSRGMETGHLDPSDHKMLGNLFDVAPCVAAEIEYENDEEGERWTKIINENPSNPHDRVRFQCRDETPEERWVRMRAWVVENLKELT
jgi:hypothetical protein